MVPVNIQYYHDIRKKQKILAPCSVAKIIEYRIEFVLIVMILYADLSGVATFYGKELPGEGLLFY